MMRTILAALVLTATATSAGAVDCEKFVKIHAFLSRAQFQCGFSKYAEDMMAQAKDCGQHMSEKRLDQSLASGMKLFDQREKERGHNQMCADVLDSFPQAVSR
jgi:hypothetical protein